MCYCDCGDQAITATDAHMSTGKRANEAIWTMMTTPEPIAKFHPERGTTSFRVVDPYNEGIYAIIDEGANANTHSDHWMENAIAKWAKK